MGYSFFFWSSIYFYRWVKIKEEKVYLTRDEGSDKIWIWRKQKKGSFSPQKLKDCSIVSYHRGDTDSADCYLVKDFKKKFNITVRSKTKKSVTLSKELLNNEDYKLFSNDPDRKK